MTCNTISLVSRLIWKCFRWKFIDIFEDVCSLHTCFSADSFCLLCYITPCESSGRFFGPPGIFPFNSWLSFQRLRRLLWWYNWGQSMAWSCTGSATQLILFNWRRSGEVSQMTVDNFLATANPADSKLTQHLPPVELHLSFSQSCWSCRKAWWSCTCPLDCCF